MGGFQKNNNKKEWFTQLLLKWNKEKNNRKMPWKGEKDSYKIWLSEIILQQTRVEQGLGYYKKFIQAFPDIHRLANATDERVYKMWEGLGYYTRCKNLLYSARYISRELDGIFPGTYEEIKALKGVGPYTAAAIASFAFNLPYAVADGNVFRVLARVFGIKEPVHSPVGKKKFLHLANELLYRKQPGIYNQAIMDFGAVICKPATPLCTNCIFNKNCFAFLHNKIDLLPVNKKKIHIRQRWFYYLVLEWRKKFAIRQRMGKDIWQNLFEFPLIEATEEIGHKKILQLAVKDRILKEGGYEILSVSPPYKQRLSHQLISGRFLKIKLKQKTVKANDWIWISTGRSSHYAFPAFINQNLKKSGAGKNLF
ncbi:MAG: A/G-specific adenine glycosylase [Sphingobacteriales bacterium UTBCD1]|jgi:A/G-specific adenine glycosylase|nr:MAG: A/G-specific adenine glycosylase [Sphingobacteriales bacterium UTBCD1]